VLFADQAGEVMKIVAEDCDLHTVLRLPRGTFTPYSNGREGQRDLLHQGLSDGERLDLRRPHQREQITKKDRPLTAEHFKEFEKCFGSDPNGKAKRKPTDSKETAGAASPSPK
jgi:type I restriction enzyme M protein